MGAPLPRKDGYLVVGGASHDMDFARLQILQVLADYPHLRMQVAANFEDVEAIGRVEFLIAYTCNVAPSAAAEAALHRFVAGGKRWLALHATNALFSFTPDGVAARDAAPTFIETLGSQFLAHPPLRAFTVTADEPDHPLVAGLGEFETVDELYLSRLTGGQRVLLSTQFAGETPNFAVREWSDDAPRPVLYLNRVGQGEVAYLTLGHARGRYDAPHKAAYLPAEEHESWRTPQFQELLRRTVRWAARMDEFAAVSE